MSRFSFHLRTHLYCWDKQFFLSYGLSWISVERPSSFNLTRFRHQTLPPLWWEAVKILLRFFSLNVFAFFQPPGILLHSSWASQIYVGSRYLICVLFPLYLPPFKMVFLHFHSLWQPWTPYFHILYKWNSTVFSAWILGITTMCALGTVFRTKMVWM